MAAVDVAKYIMEQLVEHPDDLSVSATDGEILILINKADMGRVIGKMGKTARAVRTVLRAAASRENMRYNVEFKEKNES